MSKKIPLTKGKFVIVDDADYAVLSKHKWTYDRYAFRVVGSSGNQKILRMHRVICGAKTGQRVGFKNGDKLDCTRVNITFLSQTLGNANAKKRNNTSSKYRGVCRLKTCNRWMAGITTKGKHNYLGIFLKEDDAARAYNRHAQKHFGKWAKLNKIRKSS